MNDETLDRQMRLVLEMAEHSGCDEAVEWIRERWDVARRELERWESEPYGLTRTTWPG
jgi:hypothetical protein